MNELYIYCHGPPVNIELELGRSHQLVSKKLDFENSRGIVLMKECKAGCVKR
jgi:hypothetical protein